MEKYHLGKYDKSSQALLNIMGHYVGEVETLHQFTLLAMMGQFSWNVSLLPLDQQKKFIKDFSRKFPLMDRDKIRSLLRLFVERKEELYPGDCRFMADISTSERKRTYHLSVVTLFPEADAKAIEENKEKGTFVSLPLCDFLERDL